MRDFEESRQPLTPEAAMQVRVVMVGAKANKTSGAPPVVRVTLKHAGISYLFDKDLKKWVPWMTCVSG